MEDRFQVVVPGQAVIQSDINLMATEASLADDRTLAELLRMAPADFGPTIDRGIIPFGYGGAGARPPLSTVVPSGSANASVSVNPFRAIIGSRALASAGALANWRDIRSAIAVGSTTLNQVLQLDAIIVGFNRRWDLIYARVDIDIDGPSVSRMVKTAPGTVNAQSIVTTKKTTVTLGIVKGTETTFPTNPTRPSVPSDSGSSFYIPLAYVYCQDPFTSSTAVVARNIDNVANVLKISPSLGVTRSGPANQPNFPGAWPSSTRPNTLLSKEMTGQDSRFLLMAYADYGLNTSFVIDDTIDWRKRFIRAELQTLSDTNTLFPTPGGLPTFPTTNAVPSADPLVGVPPKLYHGQSFAGDWDPSASGTPTRALVAVVGGTTVTFTRGVASTGTLLAAYQSTQMAANALLAIYVDMSTGNLMGFVNGTSGNCDFYIWITATGQMANAY